jgi:hypothetical protein
MIGPTVIKLTIVMAVLAFFVHVFACFFWRVKVDELYFDRLFLQAFNL